MNRTLAILLSLVGAAVVVIGAAVCVGFYFGIQQDKVTQAYSEQLVRSIGKDWDIGVVQANADPDFLKSVSRAKLKAVLGLFKTKLGHVVSVDSSSGTSQTNFSATDQEWTNTSRYTVKVKFEKGGGDVVLVLKKRAGVWKLLNLNVNSDLLLDLPAN